MSGHEEQRPCTGKPFISSIITKCGFFMERVSHRSDLGATLWKFKLHHYRNFEIVALQSGPEKVPAERRQNPLRAFSLKG
jgi:hypothetical protein